PALALLQRGRPTPCLLVARTPIGHKTPHHAFTPAIQLGTLVAVFVYFREDVTRLVRAFVADLRSRKLGSTPDARMVWKIVLGTIPAVVIATAFKSYIKGALYTLPVIASAAIVFSLLLLAAEMWAKRRARRGMPRPTGVRVPW